MFTATSKDNQTFTFPQYTFAATQKIQQENTKYFSAHQTEKLSLIRKGPETSPDGVRFFVAFNLGFGGNYFCFVAFLG